VSEQITLRIDLDSEVPAYRQVVNAIRILLVSGQLVPGAELPSVRRMAIDLGVHFNTVAEAYRILADEGWVALRHGKGATVVKRKMPEPSAERLEEFRSRLESLAAEMVAQGASPEKIGSELLRVWSAFKS
jgi:GntR family transcriptional regulator